MDSKNNERAVKLIEALGYRAICDRVGITRHSVARARQLGLPASWYIIIQSMCVERGIPCDPRAFSFKFEEE